LDKVYRVRAVGDQGTPVTKSLLLAVQEWRKKPLMRSMGITGSMRGMCRHSHTSISAHTSGKPPDLDM